LFGQNSDSLKKITPKDTIKIPFDNNRLIKENIFTTNSDTIGINDFLWNDKRNLSEILNEQPGFFINFFNKASRNIISFMGSEDLTGIFKDGVPLNDPFIRSFDIENISVNEIQKIELVSSSLSFLYGQYSLSKAVNVITKDPFIPNMLTQLRYTQDRDGALYADLNFTYPVSRKLNFSLGINNHGSEGNYTNTDFSLWRGRMRLNYFPSNKFNISINYSQNKFYRGLNEGLFNSTKDTLLDLNLADSRNTDAYEKDWNYFGDIHFNMKLFGNKDNITKVIFYSQNKLREYRDEENRTNPNGIYIEDNFHFLKNGIKLEQTFKMKFLKDKSISFLAGGNIELNSINLNINHQDTIPINSFSYNNFFEYNIKSAFARADLELNNLSLSGGLKIESVSGTIFLSYGGEAKYLHNINKDFRIKINAGIKYTKTRTYYRYSNFLPYDYTQNETETGFTVFYKNLSMRSNFYFMDIKNLSLQNADYSLNYKSEFFDGVLNVSTLDNNFSQNNLYPKLTIKSDISYHNYFFKKKLNLRIGINLKYLNEFFTRKYDQENDELRTEFLDEQKKSLFNFDFYIGARIGKANISLTFANLLNNLNYDTYLYPYDNRGGFLQSLSRFSITWDFWN